MPSFPPQNLTPLPSYLNLKSGQPFNQSLNPTHVPINAKSVVQFCRPKGGGCRLRMRSGGCGQSEQEEMEALKQKVDELEVKLARCGGGLWSNGIFVHEGLCSQQQFGNSDCGSLSISSHDKFPPTYFSPCFFPVNVVLHRLLFIFFNIKYINLAPPSRQSIKFFSSSPRGSSQHLAGSVF